MNKISLKCSCGKIQGHTENVDADSGVRLICCCKDCQAFVEYLEKQDSVLDQYGGTDIFQMPISYVKITRGKEYLACLKLSAKGLHRWYGECCNTPIGNTLGSGSPFIGLIHSFMEHSTTRDQELGQSRAYVNIKHAKQRIPVEKLGSANKVLFRSLRKLFVWKLKGLSKPTAFFDKKNQPVSLPVIVNE